MNLLGFYCEIISRKSINWQRNTAQQDYVNQIWQAYKESQKSIG